jgi:hypothetical protein
VATVRVPGRRTDNHEINVEVLNQSAVSELFQNYMKLVKVQTSKGEVDPVHTGETAPTTNEYDGGWPQRRSRHFLEKNLLPLMVIHHINQYQNYNLELLSLSLFIT